MYRTTIGQTAKSCIFTPYQNVKNCPTYCVFSVVIVFSFVDYSIDSCVIVLYACRVFVRCSAVQQWSLSPCPCSPPLTGNDATLPIMHLFPVLHKESSPGIIGRGCLSRNNRHQLWCWIGFSQDLCRFGVGEIQNIMENWLQRCLNASLV